ncbi:MAG: hypothetical protein KDC82_02715, partial [Bacteroidetes bacterium]|nr:hypothetical protein [Bacteroidota bacterium]
FHTKNGYRKISAVELSYYTRNYFLPDNYDKAGIIFQLLSTDAKEYRSIQRPDGRKFDKEERDVITGSIIQKMIEEDFEEDNNLNFSKRDWEYLDLQKRNHFAHYFYTQNLDYFKKNQINAELLIPIIANSYLKKGKDYPNLEAAVKDYKLRMDAPITYDLLQKEYKLLGLYGIDEANNCYLSSLVFPCLEGNCNFGEGTVDMGKTSFSGSFINGFASSGVITEKNSGIKIKVDFDPTTKLLKSGEYISDPRLKASFTRKLDGIYFDVDTKSFSYQGTTMGLSGRSGILTGKHTIKKEDFYEIYNYNKGEVDLLSATLREASVGEFEYTGAYKMLEGNLIPFGKGRISFPYYSKESAAIEVKGNLFDAIQASPEAMKILFSIFEKNKEINTPYLKLWHEQYLSIQDANRYAIIQELSNEDLLKFVYKENESKLKNLKIAHGSLSDLINRDWRDAYSPKSILLISKKDGVSNFCLRSQNGSSASVKYNFDNKCVAFEKRGDVQEISLKVLTSAPYQIDLVCDGCNPDNYFAIFY